ncbi:Gfo/Idh/MocA family protein [Thalassococcus lentus]|uniref:Gfo/Idh/MocA family oxidoreductase n=1 Tax=Thalassococcus lentus TaxID=1210524 RepID=A0ABT4XU95_9RHOB|nr:Gfo/Idh/MocA family oxidoreductase [Thalassococcus lentus]MDA7425543.1 Gfo/Idh/MocA family oxidoreductase [Thalassococcus lentus]
MTDKKTLSIGLIGSGFMGKAHVFGFATAQKVFDLPFQIRLHTVADITDEAAAKAAHEFGFEHATSNWRDMLTNPEIDVIDITAPNALHKQMALEAIAAGKHVYCEKPLAPLAADALEMTKAAEAAGVKTQVGFNYLCNPLFRLAKEMIEGGELGEIRSYRGLHAEDYMSDAQGPYTFRHDPEGGGALADLGSHALATAEYLLGPITKVLGDCVTAITERPDGKGGHKAIEVDDIGRAFVRFANGASGSIEGNWIATGRKMQHDFEVHGAKGALCFSQERFNELHFYSNDDKPGRRGFRRIEAAPEHPPYGNFCVAPGHQIGFNDLKAIEVAGYVNAIAGNGSELFSFRDGLRIQDLVEKIHKSSTEGRWIDV